MSGRFKGLTNNGGSRGDEGRWLRRLYQQHGITPPADLGARHKPQDEPGQRGGRRNRPRRKRTQVSSGVERWDVE